MKKKIAILASANKERSEAILKCFNGGSRVEIPMILTDRENSPLIELNGESGTEVIFLDREKWHNAAEIAQMLHDRRIDLLVTDDFRPVLPDEISQAFAHRILDLGESSPSEATALIMEHLQREAANPDRVWAEALGIKYEEQKVIQADPASESDAPKERPGAVPPPVPPTVLHSGFPLTGTPGPNPAGMLRQTPPPAPRQTGRTMPPTYLVWSIVCTLLCFMVPGILAIIFSSQVSTKYFAGDYEGAERASRRAEIWIIVSFVLGVISATLYFPLMMVRNMI